MGGGSGGGGGGKIAEAVGGRRVVWWRVRDGKRGKRGGGWRAAVRSVFGGKVRPEKCEEVA